MFKISNSRVLHAIWLSALILGCISCKRSPVSWDVDQTLPLFHSSFSLDDVDSKYLKYGASDSGYTLEYENTLYSYKVNDLQVSDTGIDASFNLRKLRLNDQEIANTITLGDINPLFKVLNGQSAQIPAQDQSNLDPTDIDASEFFETATLDTGYLDISITNDLPVTISLIVFELRNAETNALVASDSFKQIPANGGKATQTIDLAGKTVTKNLKGSIKRLVTEASVGAVLIDASKGLTVTLGVRNLRPSYAIAAFPTQDVIDQDEGIVLDMNGAEIKYFKVRSGRLRIKVISTIQEDMSMVLSLPGTTKDGKAFYQELSLPGPAGKGSATTEQIYDMTGYVLDFRGKDPEIKDTVNTFHQILRVTLDSSGRKLAVGLSDSIRLEYRLEGMKPEYAIGYLGNTLSRTGLDTVDFDLFKGLDGDMTFKDVKMDFVLRNSIGAEGRLKLHHLKGLNVFNGRNVTFDADPLKSDIVVKKPAFQRGAYEETRFSLGVSNSNIKTFLEVLPQKLEYDLETEVSPGGNVNNYQDFVFDNSRMDVIMRLDVPISFSFGGLTLRDTQAVNFKDLGDMSRVKSATLFLNLLNYFPLDFEMEFQLMDKNFNSLGYLDLSPTAVVPKGDMDASGQVIRATEIPLNVKLPREKAMALSKTQFIGIVMKVKGTGSMQKIYGNSRLDMRAKVQFEYEIRN
jgi:hypothetical protein